jgi:protein-tyrosine phosphatase
MPRENASSDLGVPALRESALHARLANFRDLGGLPLSDGGTTRGGVLYRSDVPLGGDASPIASWPPITVVDLRSEEEQQRLSPQWPVTTNYHHLPLHDAARLDRIAPASLPDVYRAIIADAGDRIAQAVALVVASPGSALVHCSAGKDRTGIVVAALLLSAGVDAEAVRDDYLSTAANMDAVRARWRARIPRRPRTEQRSRPIFEVSQEAIDVVIGSLLATPGGAQAWLTARGAPRDHLEAWAARLSGGSQSSPRSRINEGTEFWTQQSS